MNNKAQMTTLSITKLGITLGVMTLSTMTPCVMTISLTKLTIKVKNSVIGLHVVMLNVVAPFLQKFPFCRKHLSLMKLDTKGVRVKIIENEGINLPRSFKYR